MLIFWIVAGVIIVVLVWGIILQLPKTRGWAFEKTVSVILSRLPKKDYMVMNNLFFRDGRSTCQIDHLVISPYGVFVIEAKNYLRVIAGDGRDKMLRRKVLGMNYKTRNPIDQNNWHIKFLIDHFPIMRDHQEAMVPIVVFNFSSSLKIKNAPCPVCKIQNLLKTIKEFESVIINKNMIYSIQEEIKIKNKNFYNGKR